MFFKIINHAVTILVYPSAKIKMLFIDKIGPECYPSIFSLIWMGEKIITQQMIRCHKVEHQRQMEAFHHIECINCTRYIFYIWNNNN